MSNPRFAFTNLSSYEFSVSSEDPLYPSANLKNYIPTDYWQSANTDPAYVIINFGQEIQKDFVVIHEHNLTELGGDGPPKLQASSTPDFSSDVTDVIADLSSAANPFYQEFTPVNKQYWRIYHDSGIPAAAPMKIGQTYIGARLDFQSPYDFPCNLANPEYKTDESYALDGTARTSQNYPGRLTWDISFVAPGISNDVKAAWRTFFSTVRGKLRPFYFIDIDDALYFVKLKFDNDSVQDFRANLNLLKKIQMEEIYATREDGDLSNLFILDESTLDGPDVLAPS